MAQQILLLFAVICIFSSLVLAQLQNRTDIGLKSIGRPTVDCHYEFKFKCAGCRNIAICAGEAFPVSVKSCDTTRPYCVDGTCTADLPLGKVCEAEFRCSGPGYFPHPADCSNYFFCDKANGAAYEYSCGVNRVYNSKDKSCGAKVKPTDCQIIDCSKTSNAFVGYAPHLAYYAFCFSTKTDLETIVYKCDDENTSEFNLKTLECEFRCPDEGRYPSPGDCKSFYECSKVGRVVSSVLWSCPPGLRFDVILGRCAPGTC